ncbi:hypothetical protein PanWU01x14_154200, partial [Parasponia andersonii]
VSFSRQPNSNYEVGEPQISKILMKFFRENSKEDNNCAYSYVYTMLTDLNARGIEVQDADLGTNITKDSELDPVIERSVLDQIDGVGLEKVDPIDGYGGHHLPAAVRLLIEPGDRGFPQRNPSVHDGKPGLAVLDPHLVGVDHREEHPNVERERRGGRVQIWVGRGGLGGGIG